jgi:hypothetical protein
MRRRFTRKVFRGRFDRSKYLTEETYLPIGQQPLFGHPDYLRVLREFVHAGVSLRYDADSVAANEAMVVGAIVDAAQSHPDRVAAVLAGIADTDIVDPLARFAVATIREHAAAGRPITREKMAAIARAAQNGAAPPARARDTSTWEAGQWPDVPLDIIGYTVADLAAAAARRRAAAVMQAAVQHAATADDGEWTELTVAVTASLTVTTTTTTVGAALAEKTDHYVLDTQARMAAREALAVAEFAKPDPPRTLADILTNPKRPPGFLVTALIHLRGFVIFVGIRKGGKTTLLGDVLLSVLEGPGSLVLGRVEWDVIEPLDGDVLLLSYEMGEDWAVDLETQGLGAYKDRIRIWDLMSVANPLATAAGRAELLANLEGVGLVIVDTYAQAYFAGLAPGGGVNEDANAWMNMLRGIIGPDRILWMSVHAGWEGHRSKGASAIEEQPWSIITLEEAANGVRYISTRGRKVEQVKRLPLRFDPKRLRSVADDHGTPWTVANAKDTPADGDAVHRDKQARKRSLAVEADESDQWRVLRFLAKQTGPVGRRPIRAATSLSADKTPVMCEGLRLRGCATEVMKAGWVITEAGRAAVQTGVLPPNKNA